MMSEASRQRLARIVREPACDLAEAALLCCVEAEPKLSVDAALRRVDALAEGLRTSGFRRAAQPGGGQLGGSADTAQADARALARYLAGEAGFTGDTAGYHDPQNGLLTGVLDRRQGLPIALAIIYIAVGRRVGLRTFGINTPGHFLVGVGGGDPRGGEQTRPAVIDPFYDGILLSDADIERRVRATTEGRATFDPGMLRPASPPVVIRRLLNNLTRDFLGQGRAEDALWTVELKRLLPGGGPADVRTASQLLIRMGRYRQAAELLEAELERSGISAAQPRKVSLEMSEMARLARHARAKMN